MKFLLRGWCLTIARRLLEEGNSVRMSNAFSKHCGEGIVELCEFTPSNIDWADVVIFDINDGDLPGEAEKLRKKNKLVIGSSGFAGELENDRTLGTKIAQDCGIKTNPVYTFQGKDAFPKVYEFLSTQKKDSQWVWKSNGSSPNDPPTYVGKELPFFIRMLGHYEDFYKAIKVTPSFIITPRIEGVEVSTEGWFNGRQFFLANHTLEKNRFLNNDLGKKTGCAGCIVWEASDSRLFHKLIPSLGNALAGKYNGPVDVNAIINKETNEPTFLEFTPRFGYDALYALIELLDGDLGSLLYSCAAGKMVEASLKEDLLAGTLHLSIPPFPEAGDSDNESIGVPIFGVDPDKYSPHISLGDLKIDDEDDLVCAGPSGEVLVVSDTGDSVEEVYDKIYKRAETLEIPQVGYRTDLAESTYKCYDMLMATNWCEDLGSKRKLSFEDIVNGNGKRGFRNHRSVSKV